MSPPPDTDSDDEDFLLALEATLDADLGDEPCACAGKAYASSPSTPSTSARWSCAGSPLKDLGHGLVQWPVEVRLGVAAFLPWRELVGNARLCRAWRVVEAEDVLWKVYFGMTWPRLATRRAAGARASGGGVAWRAIFRARWCTAERGEDALEEDWLDFSLAQRLGDGAPRPPGRAAAAPGPTAAAQLAAADDLRRALLRCREELLLTRGLHVPSEADGSHICTQGCRYHRLQLDSGGDAFLCEASGSVHQCRDGVPCECCVVDDIFFICPASGRCFPKEMENCDEAGEAAEAAPVHDWDPDLSANQQFARWFEQGYSMSEEQATEYFDRGRRPQC